MALKLTAMIDGDVPLANAYVRSSLVGMDKDRDFNARLQAALDSVLDEIDAINADESMGEVARTELLAPLHIKRDNLQERLAAHPNGALFIVAKLSVLTSASATKAKSVPDLDVKKFKEVRFLPGAIEYRNSDAGPVTTVAISGSDPVNWVYALVKSLPEVSALSPADV